MRLLGQALLLNGDAYGALCKDRSPLRRGLLALLTVLGIVALARLTGLVWGIALLLRTVAFAHGFGLWKTFGAVLLTFVFFIYIVLPLSVLPLSMLAAANHAQLHLPIATV